MTRHALRTCISVDFDFFIYEDPSWDWGHSDALAHIDDLLWNARYQERDLHTETSILRHADFIPSRLVMRLQRLGFDLSYRPDRLVGVADSHGYIIPFIANGRLKRASEPVVDLVVNIDAHHDCWTFNGRVECDSWMTLLRHEWPRTRFVHLYPQWKSPELDGPAQRDATRLNEASPHNLDITTFAKWPGPRQPFDVTHVFVCRSSPWVPPHHDPDFLELVKSLASTGRAKELEKLTVREAPTVEEAAAMRQAHQDALRDLLSKVEGR